MKSWEFTKGNYTIKIYAYDEYAADKIWEALQSRNYYPTSKKVRQISHDFGYEIML